MSQIDLYRVEQPEQFVNQKLLCMVAEANPEERNLVVSRRALLEQERQEKQEQLWAEVKEGQIRKGVVARSSHSASSSISADWTVSSRLGKWHGSESRIRANSFNSARQLKSQFCGSIARFPEADAEPAATDGEPVDQVGG